MVLALGQTMIGMMNQVADHSTLISGGVAAETTKEPDGPGSFRWADGSARIRYGSSVIVSSGLE